VLIKPILKKTPYELYKDRKPNIDKFDAKYDEGIFLGYSWNSHSYIIYNK